jgi:hypothetical protein
MYGEPNNSDAFAPFCEIISQAIELTEKYIGPKIYIWFSPQLLLEECSAPDKIY